MNYPIWFIERKVKTKIFYLFLKLYHHNHTHLDESKKSI